MLQTASAHWARVERAAAAGLALSVTLLILLNVATRSAGAALFWVDELAIYAMAWMTFLGASASLHYGNAVAITALTHTLPARGARLAAKLVDALILLFALFMVWLCWRWFNPLALAQHGGDVAAFQRATFNFIYAEPTTTLGIKKVWIWLVMWLFAGGALLHSLANLFKRTHHRESEIQE